MRYVFDQYALDTDRHELTFENRPIKLRPKVFQVLSYLIIHRDRMVPKAELLDEVWPRTVGEEVLNSCIMSARRAVGDDGRNQDTIRTTHGVGFRFVATVREISDQGVCIEAKGHDLPPHEFETRESATGQAAQSSLGGEAPALDEFRFATENRTVTALACGMKRAADLADRLGPELTHELMQDFFSNTQDIMSRHSGSVVRWLGDGFMALFGAPIAHEDDVRRAALAAMELNTLLNDRIRLFANTTLEDGFGASIGLHTGPATVGSLANAEGLQTYTARGKTTDIAVQLQNEAEAGAIFMSDETFQFVEGEVECEAYSRTEKRSKVHRLLSISRRRAGVPRRTRKSIDHFIGRREEFAILRERLFRADGKKGQVVTISGVAGIGKSRLAEEFCGSISYETTRVLRGLCFPYTSGKPYLPLIEIVRKEIDSWNVDDLSKLKERLREFITERALPKESESLILELLAIPIDERSLQHLSPHARKTQTFELLRQLFLRAAEAKTLLIVIEDLHWIDATSQAWLDTFLSRLGDVQIMVILTYRPGYSPEWLVKASATQLSLPPLTDKDSAALVRSMRREISDDVAEILVTRAGGNPFFLEELTNSLGPDLGKQGLERVPDTVHAVLASRIDRLDTGQKQVLQTCAVIGSPIFYDLLKSLVTTDVARLDQILRELEEKDFLFEILESSRRCFQFKHALTQDTAYKSLPSRTHIKIHSKIADILEKQFPNIVENQPEILAQHHQKAGNADASISYWRRAARQAFERSANIEAIDYANAGLDLLKAQGKSRGRDRTELSLQLTLAPALMAIKGYGASEVEPVYMRARTLCENIGDNSRLFRALVGIWNFRWVRAELDETRKVAQMLVDLAEKAKDPDYMLRAHGSMGEFLFHAGELDTAQFHLSKSVALSKKTSQSSLAVKIPEVVSLCYSSWACWHVGDPDQSLKHATCAVALARELSHPLSLALSLSLVAELNQFRLEVDDCLKVASEAVELSQMHGLPFWEGTSLVNLGWAQAMKGDHEEGRQCIEEGLEIFLSTGARIQMATWLGMLAEVLCICELYDDGLRAVREAHQWVEKTGERHYESELYRVEAELVKHSGSGAKIAEQKFRKAIQIASQQGAKMRDIRARSGLAQLLFDQNRVAEIDDIVAPQREWLGSASDCADVRNARAVFDL